MKDNVRVVFFFVLFKRILLDYVTIYTGGDCVKGLYIHIPFCQSICTYCDFAKEIATPKKQANYIDALIQEFHGYKEEHKALTTIYIGGGTPSALKNDDLDRLLATIYDHISMQTIEEYTVECNPNDVTVEKAKLLKKYGVNRISLGVQTFNDHHLKFINRDHREADIYQALTILREVGFDNISLDMMFGLVGQTLDELNDDLQKVIRLNPNHISYYSLILEEATPLFYLVNKGQVTMIDDDLEGSMYETVMDTLIEAKYAQYEISNFAKKDYASKHNTIYWKNDDYVGIGASSHGKLNNKRYANIRSVKRYIESVASRGMPENTSYPYEPLRDYLLMGLRLLEGVSLDAIKERFDVDLLEHYPKLNPMLEQGFLTIEQNHLKFTRRGLLLGNDVFVLF